jgi:hypothetical protein
VGDQSFRTTAAVRSAERSLHRYQYRSARRTAPDMSARGPKITEPNLTSKSSLDGADRNPGEVIPDPPSVHPGHRAYCDRLRRVRGYSGPWSERMTTDRIEGSALSEPPGRSLIEISMALCSPTFFSFNICDHRLNFAGINRDQLRKPCSLRSFLLSKPVHFFP